MHVLGTLSSPLQYCCAGRASHFVAIMPLHCLPDKYIWLCCRAGVVLYGTCGLQHLLLRLPSDSAWGACDIADMDQDGPLPPHATSQTGG
jgi:hypothetical protein